MTEYELADLLNSNGQALVETFAVFVSLMAAYLVAVYLVGDKLARSQLMIISCLYVVAGLFFIWTTLAFANRAIYYADAMEALHPDQTYGAQPFARNIIVLAMLLGMIASLWFVRKVRHTRNN